MHVNCLSEYLAPKYSDLHVRLSPVLSLVLLSMLMANHMDDNLVNHIIFAQTVIILAVSPLI